MLRYRMLLYKIKQGEKRRHAIDQMIPFTVNLSGIPHRRYIKCTLLNIARLRCLEDDILVVFRAEYICWA